MIVFLFTILLLWTVFGGFFWVINIEEICSGSPTFKQKMFLIFCFGPSVWVGTFVALTITGIYKVGSWYYEQLGK